MDRTVDDALSEADRAAIDSISGEALSRKAGQVWDAADAAGRELMAGKIAFTAATDADIATLEKASGPVIENVRQTVTAIREKSTAVNRAITEGRTAIVGALYNLAEGTVTPVHTEGRISL